MWPIVGGDAFASSELVRLPIFHTMTEESQDDVMKVIKSFFESRNLAKLRYVYTKALRWTSQPTESCVVIAYAILRRKGLFISSPAS